MSVANISAGDRLRLDIDSVGAWYRDRHGTRRHAGEPHRALRRCERRRDQYHRPQREWFRAGDKVTVGTPANHETVTIATVGAARQGGASVDFTPALRPGARRPRVRRRSGNGARSRRAVDVQPCGEPAVQRSWNGDQPPGRRCLPIQQPARPAARHRHHIRQSSEERSRDRCGRTRRRRYDGGLPGTAGTESMVRGALSPAAGDMVLRDAAGLVVDSLNYGLLVDPWASEGYQGGVRSGTERLPRADARLRPGGFGPDGGRRLDASSERGPLPRRRRHRQQLHRFSVAGCHHAAGRGSIAGATNIKVASVADFAAGQTILIDRARTAKPPSSRRLARQARRRRAAPRRWARPRFLSPPGWALFPARRSPSTVARARRRR